jgi:thiol:disulfide interchange protein DsbC
MKRTLMAMLVGVVISLPALAEDDLKTKAENQLKKVLGPTAEVTEIISLGKNQVFEVMLLDGGLMHMTPDMNFIIHQNTLYEITDSGLQNISDMRMSVRRAQEMASIPDADTVVFKAKGEEKAVINVFTDIDCGYCQKLHREVEGINEYGITVRYLAFPRAGVADQQGDVTEAFRKINYVWCQKDRSEAMTKMKAAQADLSQAYSRVRGGSSQEAMAEFDKQRTQMGKMLSAEQCSSPVAAQYQLGRAIGVSGTPAMVTTEGALIPGYMKAEDLAKRLGVL